MQGKKVIHIHIQEFEAITQAHYLNGEPVEPAYNLIKVYYNGKIQFETGLDTFENVVRGYTHLTGEDTWKDTVYTISSQPLHPHTYSECWGHEVEEHDKSQFVKIEEVSLWEKYENLAVRTLLFTGAYEILVEESAEDITDGYIISAERRLCPRQARRERMLNLYRNYVMCA